MKRDYRLFIKDMINAMSAIEEFVGELTFEDFIKDDKTLSAVIRKFEIVGEATKNIPDNIRQRYPYIPWKLMAGMRDRLIHAYFGIDYKLVWYTVKTEIPKLKPKLQKILEELEGNIT